MFRWYITGIKLSGPEMKVCKDHMLSVLFQFVSVADSLFFFFLIENNYNCFSSNWNPSFHFYFKKSVPGSAGMFQVIKSLSLVPIGIIAWELREGIRGIFLLFTADLWSFLRNSRLFKWVHVSNPKLGNFVSFLFPFCRSFLWSHLTSLMETTTGSLCLTLSL